MLAIEHERDVPRFGFIVGIDYYGLDHPYCSFLASQEVLMVTGSGQGTKSPRGCKLLTSQRLRADWNKLEKRSFNSLQSRANLSSTSSFPEFHVPPAYIVDRDTNSQYE